MMIRLRNVGNRFGELIACIAITNPVPPSLVMVEGRRDMHMPKWGRERERERQIGCERGGSVSQHVRILTDRN